MRKGISAVIATVIVLAIMITIMGVAYTFFFSTQTETEGSAKSQTEKELSEWGVAFKVENRDFDKIYIRNLGSSELSGLTFYSNNEKKEVTSDCGGVIETGGVCGFTIPDILPDQEYEIKITAPGGKETFTILSPYTSSTVSVITSSTTTTTEPGTETCGDTVYLGFADPTDEDGETVYRDWTYVNTSLTAYCDASSFIDWNRSLIGYWSFDSFDATHVFDNSTYGNNGTRMNGPVITTGKYGNALQFDGVDDYINCSKTSSLNSIAEKITVEAWIYPKGWGENGNSGYGRVVDKNYFVLYIVNDGGSTSTSQSLKFHLYTDDWYYAHTPDNSISLNTWQHVAATYDSTTLRMYINGVEQPIEYYGEAPSGSIASHIYYNLLMGESAEMDRAFNGSIDEVLIWNRVLSPEEIKASYNTGLYSLYHNFTNLANGNYNYYAYIIDEMGATDETETRTINIENTPICGDTVYLGFADPTDPPGYIASRPWTYVNTTVNAGCDASSFIDWNRSLIGYWSFDSYNATHVFDNSTYGKNGTLSDANWTNYDGSTPPLWTSGKFGSAINFDGVDDYIDCGSSGIFNIINDTITIEAWINVNSGVPTGVDNKIVCKKCSWYALGGYVFYYAQPSPTYGRLYLVGGANGTGDEKNFTYGDTPDLRGQGWQHVAGVIYKNASSPTGYSGAIYLNGNSLSLSSNHVRPAGWPAGNSRNLHIGATSCITPGSVFDGSIDEVRVWNRALSPEEIKASYNTGMYRLYHNFTSLANGNYNYYAYAIDEDGATDETETRTIIISS